jgi:PAS domain S-box-containing protein
MPVTRSQLFGAPNAFRRLLGVRDDAEVPYSSLGGWISESLSRRVVMVVIGLVAGAAMRTAGLGIPSTVFLLLAGWLVTSSVLLWRFRRHVPAGEFWPIHFAAQSLDVVLTLVLCHLLGATLWMAPLLMAMTVSLGGQTLPRLYGLLLSALATVSYAAALGGYLNGWFAMRGPFAPVSQPTAVVAVAMIISVAIIFFAIAAVQRGYYRHIATVEQRHSRVLEAASDMIVTVDRDGRYVSANAAVESNLGWPRDHIIGDTIFDSVDEADRAVARAAFAKVLAGQTIAADLRIRAADESRRVLSSTGAPILDENGAVVAALFIGRDVTLARAQAAQIAESERNLRLIVRSMNETVFTVDRELRFRAVYGQWSDTSSITPANILGRSIREVLGDEAGAAMELPVQRALQGEPVDFEQDVPATDPPRTLRLSITPLRDDDDLIVGVTGVAFDVTEQRLAERERDALQSRLEESRRMVAIGRLVSGVAHELNNPLAAILTFAEQLRAEPRSPADEAALATIYGQAIRSRAIVRDLLTFVRPGPHRSPVRLEVREVVRGAVRALEPHLSMMNVSLHSTDIRDECWVEGDAAGIEQVVTNLVLNAAQAAGSGGQVRVGTVRSDGRCVIHVEDTGPGIAEEALPHLFEPFFTTKPVGQGTGLGLSVSMGVAQRHNGDLRASNLPEGGARFEFVLPLVASERLTEREVVTAPVVLPEAGLHVLLVDDEDSIRHSLKRYFERRSWRVSEAADGAAALAVIRTYGAEAISLIICDLRMPGMNGAEFHAVLEEEHPELLRRMILASGDTVSPEVAGLLRTSPCRVLEKPFELVALGKLADELLSGQQRSASQ